MKIIKISIILSISLASLFKISCLVICDPWANTPLRPRLPTWSGIVSFIFEGLLQLSYSLKASFFDILYLLI
jgi:uncharacterized protein involved in cysteine biosynthesis